MNKKRVKIFFYLSLLFLFSCENSLEFEVLTDKNKIYRDGKEIYDYSEEELELKMNQLLENALKSVNYKKDFSVSLYYEIEFNEDSSKVSYKLLKGYNREVNELSATLLKLFDYNSNIVPKTYYKIIKKFKASLKFLDNRLYSFIITDLSDKEGNSL